MKVVLLIQVLLSLKTFDTQTSRHTKKNLSACPVACKIVLRVAVRNYDGS